MDFGITRTKKRRATQVCLNCRVRKVKCDLSTNGTSCSNCVEDEVECIATESRRGRKYRQKKHRPDQPPYASSSHSQESTQSTNPSFYAENTRHSPSTLAKTSRRLESQSTESPDLPAYIRGARPTANLGDIHLLAARGALAVPETELRDELIRAFVLYVHPYLPVLDLQDFLDTIHQNHDSNQCSLILVQAVMFAGSAFVDMGLLEKLGFRTRRAAREAFFSQVKLLYDFDWEPDRIPVIQALLLASYWYVSSDDQKDPWHWIGVCLSMATSVGLGNNSQQLQVPPKARRLWRRLWWMCILRARVFSMSTRKMLHIREQDIHTPLLTLDDFEITAIHTSIAALAGLAVLNSPETRMTLARLCIENVRLSIHISRILTRTYTVRSISNVTTNTVMLYSPKDPAETISEAVTLYHDLDQWQISLPDDCAFIGSARQGRTNDDDGGALLIHRAVLSITFLMASSILYRPLFSAKAREDHALTLFLSDIVRPRVLNFASEAASLAQLLNAESLIPKLPPSAVIFFLSAVATSLVEIRAAWNKARCDEAGSQLYWSCHALLQLRDTYPIGDETCVLVKGLVSKVRIRGGVPGSILHGPFGRMMERGPELPGLEPGSGSLPPSYPALADSERGNAFAQFSVTSPAKPGGHSNVDATVDGPAAEEQAALPGGFEDYFSQDFPEERFQSLMELILAENDGLE